MKSRFIKLIPIALMATQFLATGAAHAVEPPDKDTYIQCLSIAIDQRERDPDPEMKAHWNQYSDIYAANAFYFTKSVDTVMGGFVTESEKFENMRNMLGGQMVGKLSLAILERCDQESLNTTTERVDDWKKALNEWNAKRKNK